MSKVRGARTDYAAAHGRDGDVSKGGFPACIPPGTGHAAKERLFDAVLSRFIMKKGRLLI
jgi:hypothetical protein